MVLSENKSQKNEFWKAHILKAKDFSGSDEEYCVANALSKSAFYIFKRRLGFTRPHKPYRSTFVKVGPVHKLSEVPGKAEGSRLPDPIWVAQFIIALTGKK